MAILARAELAGTYEVGRSARQLLPVALAAAAPVALCGGALVEVVRSADQRRWRVVAAIFAAIFGGVVAYGVSGGRQIAALRGPFVIGVAAAGAAVAYVAAPRAARWLAPRESRWWRGAVVIAVGLGVLAVELCNATVLPRLYPAFHLGLTVLAVLIAPFASLAWDSGAPGQRAARARARSRLVRVAAALVLFAASTAFAPAAARALAHADNIRLIYLTHAPVLTHAVVIAAAMAPPPPLEDVAAGPDLTSARTIDLEGRDIVLVTIDALRADHVGAYGYPRPTTPSLDRLAAEGVVFEAAYTPTPHTSYAITSLMTGKYMRPLLLQSLGEDSETWAAHLRRYGYRTAGFYPPAVFFIDAERFAPLRDRALDFEYRKVEFAPAAARLEQVRAYLARVAGDRRIFLWVHLFEPHEPYEAHPEHAFGDRDVDRYDGEIAAADAGLGAIVAAVRAARPGAVVIATADHGEEFREHGGRYHGTTVYEEQVRVPLVVNAPGLFAPRRIAEPVQLIDLLPTVLAGLAIPRPARVRGADLGSMLAGGGGSEPGRAEPGPASGFAFSETETQTLLAKGKLRLVCARKIGACALYDLAEDPGQTVDVSAKHAAAFAAMRSELRALEASHGRYEVRGLRAEGKGWPEAIRRGLAGDADAADDVAALLDDADVTIRRKAAEVLFDLRRVETAAPLRLALVRDEDDEVRRWCALALTRLGEGAPMARDLYADRSIQWRRLAALALAESGDDRGEDTLIAWWREAYPARKERRGERPPRAEGASEPSRPFSFERAREIADALARIRSKAAVMPLIDALDDLRLRPHLARALAAIDHDAARPALVERLETERHQTTRVAIFQALVKLGAGPELRAPLIRALGTPDPLPDGLRVALDADVLDLVGGPRERDLTRLQRFAKSGVAVGLVVPKGGNGAGVRVLCRARSTDDQPGELRIGARTRRSVFRAKSDRSSLVPAAAPELDPDRALALAVAPGPHQEVFATLPATVKVKPGDLRELVFYSTQNVEVAACAAVPLSDEIPPPPPQPWTPSGAEADEGTPNGDAPL